MKSVNKYKMKNQKSVLEKTLILSVFFHLFFTVFPWSKFNIDLEKNFNKKNETIKISLDETSKIEELIQRSKAAHAARIKNQIVNSEKSNDIAVDEKTRFLGEKSQRFDRQTIASKIGSFKNAGLGSKTSSDNTGKNDKVKDLEVRKKNKNIKLADFGMGNIQTNPEEFKQKVVKSKSGIAEGDSRSIGVAQNNDFIEDIALGDMTKLNTKEFKYFGFYHRIRQQLEQYWGDSLRKKAEKLFKEGRRLPAQDNHITSLIIEIDGQGNVVNIFINSTSGVRELDDAAVESINRAGPFPNPPKGMIVDGRAKIEWGFVVKG